MNVKTAKKLRKMAKYNPNEKVKIEDYEIVKHRTITEKGVEVRKRFVLPKDSARAKYQLLKQEIK